jgi:drug/metabolite transporter (DMT)-like permease
MAPRYLFQLILLAAIWGSSFMFMRYAVPQLGPAWLMAIRLFSAAAFLWVVTRFLRRPLHLRRHARHYLILGLFNTALPFTIFAWSAQVLPASLLSILNSTAPLWGLVIGVVWRRKPITPRAALGLLFGMGGVATLVGFSGSTLPPGATVAVLVTLCAAACYGIASSYAEFAESVEAYANAHGSLWFAALLLTPLLPFAPLPEAWPPATVAAALALGLLCSGVAYLLYYHLIATIGAPSAMTVGYLIPLWGVFWGWLFLGERIGWNTLAGAALVLTGTALVTGLRVQSLLRRWLPAR